MEKVEGLKGLESVFSGMQAAYEDMGGNLEIMLEGEMDGLEKDHKRFFDNSVSPSGSKWAKLAPSTIQRKGHDTILVDTGALMKSLTQRGSSYSIREFYRIGQVGVALLFGTSVPYAIFHMKSTGNRPARPMVGLTKDRTDKFQEKLGDMLVEQIINAD